MYDVSTTYGTSEIVKTAATKLVSGGSPNSQTSGKISALIASVAEALIRIAGSETTRSVRDSWETSRL